MSEHTRGYEIVITERRRYGRTTFTWAAAKHNGELLPLGDPWPAVTPKRSELEQAAKLAIAEAENRR